jgi:hypothetical protein
MAIGGSSALYVSHINVNITIFNIIVHELTLAAI